MCIIQVSTWVESTGIYKGKVGTQLKCVHTHDLLSRVVQYMYCTNKCISTVNFSRHNSCHHGKLWPYRASRVISKFKKKSNCFTIYENLEKPKLELFKTSATFLRILLARCCSTLHCYYMNNQGVTYLRGRSMYDFGRRAWPSVSVCIVVWFSGISTSPRKSSLVYKWMNLFVNGEKS